MDNASKALIMAGAVLIALLIMTLFMYALNVFRDYSEDMSTLTGTTQQESFNRYFVYATILNQRIRGYDAYNVMGKALDMNQNLDSRNQIRVVLNGVSINSIPATLKDDKTWLEREFTYSYSLSNGKVSEVRISG